MTTAAFADLKGETLTAIRGAVALSDRVTFETASGRTFALYHEQDCCEQVSVNEVVGNVDDLIGSPLTMADESSDNKRNDVEDYSSTWTFYKLATIKGYVDLRWLGSSNGYYSESVSFCEEK